MLRRGRRARPLLAIILIAGTMAILVPMRLIKRLPVPFFSSLQFDGRIQNVVVASCKGKHDSLSVAASSWLALKNVGKVVLVDWESSPPYSLSLPDIILADPRFNLIRAINQSDFKITWAINLAVQFVPEGSFVLKVDCDTVISSDFFIRHPPLPNMWYAGNFRHARNENERHLNGVFLINSSLFKGVGGFDERIQGYGYDDSNLYERLSSHGAKFKLIDFNSIHHMHHLDEKRTQNVPGDSYYPTFEIYLNRYIANQLPMWNSSFPQVKYTFMKAQVGIVAVAVQDTYVIDQRRIINKNALAQAILNVSSTCLHQLEGKSFKWMMSLKPEYAVQFVNGIYRAATNTASGKMVVVHLQRDLVSRLRALSSGIAFAKKSKAWLRIIWQEDQHMGKAMKEVIDLQTSGLTDVWDSFSEDELDLALYVIHDCMNMTNICRVVNVCDKHVYIRSAGFFNSSVSIWNVQSAFHTLIQRAQPALQWDKLIWAV